MHHFLDLAKTFDIVDHSLRPVLQKLYVYGFRGIAFNLFKTYLCNRKHYTVVNELTSTTENLT